MRRFCEWLTEPLAFCCSEHGCSSRLGNFIAVLWMVLVFSWLPVAIVCAHIFGGR
jgi:hypothetical protein